MVMVCQNSGHVSELVFQNTARERNQHDEAEVKKREAERQFEARQHANFFGQLGFVGTV